MDHKIIKQIKVPEGYESWFRLVMKLFHRVAFEKGEERHGEEGVPFERQVWAEIFKEEGEGWAWGQIKKKRRESANMIKRGELSRSINEILDIAALALMIAMWREGQVLEIWGDDNKGERGFMLIEGGNKEAVA